MLFQRDLHLQLIHPQEWMEQHSCYLLGVVSLYDRTGQVMVLSSQSGHDFDLMILFGAPCFLDAIKVEKSLYFPCSLFHIFHFCQIYHFPYDKNFWLFAN